MEASIVISLQDNQMSRLNGHDNAEISSNNMSSGSSEDGSVAELVNTNGVHENGVMKRAPKQIATKNGSNSDPDFSGDGDESEQETDDNEGLEEDEDIMPRKKKAKLSEDISTHSDSLNNSNVRKSGRERKVPKKFDSPPSLIDDDEQPKQKRKYQRKQNVKENGNDVSYRPSSVHTTSNAASEEDLEDEEENFATVRIASAKRKKVSDNLIILKLITKRKYFINYYLNMFIVYNLFIDKKN